MAGLLPFGSPPGMTRIAADARYINITGDAMTGDLIFPVNGFIMTDSDGVQWRITIDTSGALVTTALTSAANAPWMSLGFTNFDT